jgi:hypothetical protein
MSVRLFPRAVLRMLKDIHVIQNYIMNYRMAIEQIGFKKTSSCNSRKIRE